MRSFLFYWNSANMLFPSLNFSWISQKTNLYKEESWLRTRFFFLEDIHLIDQSFWELKRNLKLDPSIFLWYFYFYFLLLVTNFSRAPFGIQFIFLFFYFIFWYLNSYFWGSIFTFKKYIRKTNTIVLKLNFYHQ